MANHKSAIKRARQSELRRGRNRSYRTRVKSVAKSLYASAASNTRETNLTALANAQSVIDKAAKKGVIHKRAADRRKSRLSRLINKAGAV